MDEEYEKEFLHLREDEQGKESGEPPWLFQPEQAVDVQEQYKKWLKALDL